VIAEAIDTVLTLGWALAAWIVLTALAAALALHTVLVAVAWPCMTAQKAVDAALAASRALRALPEHRHAHTASQPPFRPAPAWAQPDHKEAA
jgi:hypothetical protein